MFLKLYKIFFKNNCKKKQTDIIQKPKINKLNKIKIVMKSLINKLRVVNKMINRVKIKNKIKMNNNL